MGVPLTRRDSVCRGGVTSFSGSGSGIPATRRAVSRREACASRPARHSFDVIRAGVQGVEASNDVREAWAVRSKDFACVYMVAARVYGAGLPVEGSEPGVWAISGQEDAPGLTLAVNEIARRFTSYPDARKARPAITMAADGAEFAAHCARPVP